PWKHQPSYDRQKHGGCKKYSTAEPTSDLEKKNALEKKNQEESYVACGEKEAISLEEC
ncbi:hypothetical protein A2U01_0033375, partial [Trifolium medium]|nr:hypothetical protein [Trifolium medium]